MNNVSLQPAGGLRTLATLANIDRPAAELWRYVDTLDPMRLIFIRLAFVLLTLPVFGNLAAQTVGIRPVANSRLRPVRDTALVNALNNFELLGEARRVKGSDVAVRVFRLAGESGSAKDGESDQVIHWLYVGVSEFGEQAEQRLYRLGPFYDPKLDSLVSRDSVPVAFISYGLKSKRQHAAIVADLDSGRVLPRAPGHP